MKTTILSLSGASAAITRRVTALDGELLAQVPDDLDIVALAEEGAHRVGRSDADLLDVAQPAVAFAHLGGGLLLLHRRPGLLALLGGLQHLGQPGVGVAIFLRQDLGGRLADQRNADGIDEAVERDGLARLDRGDQIAHRQIAPALALLDLVACAWAVGRCRPGSSAARR